MNETEAMTQAESLSSSLPQIPKCLQMKSVTNGLISYLQYDNSEEYRSYMQAAHTYVWAPWEGRSCFGEYKAAVMMQMRYDGTFGFPGGFIDKNENLLVGLNREMEEEIGWNPLENPITWSDYYSTKVTESKRLVCHFFIKKITINDFMDIEKKCLNSREFGSEVLGVTRVPLYVMENTFQGLPAFLNNVFVGDAKQQLLLALYHTKILSEVEIEGTMFLSQRMKLVVSSAI